MMLDPLRLEVQDTVGARQVLVDHTPFSIGRRESNDLRLNGSEVSREHAIIEQEGGHYVLRDLESRYGTFVNDTQVTRHVIASGDRIRLGRGGGGVREVEGHRRVALCGQRRKVFWQPGRERFRGGEESRLAGERAGPGNAQVPQRDRCQIAREAGIERRERNASVVDRAG